MPPAAHILPRENATPLEIALDLDLEARVLDIPVPIRDLWRWDTCPPEFLPYLAWAMSVDLWSDAWSEERKREVIRDSFKLHRLKGTYGGLKRFVRLVDSRAVRAITPPQAAFAAPSDYGLEAWESTLPQLRIYPRTPISTTSTALFADIDFVDDDGPDVGGYLEPDNGRELTQERVVYVENGTETEINLLDDGSGDTYGRPSIASATAIYCDADFCDDGFVCSDDDAERDVIKSRPPIGFEKFGLRYRPTRASPDFITSGGPAGRGVAYCDDAIADSGLDSDPDGDYATPDTAYLGLYRRWFTYSPKTTPGDPDSFAYCDAARLGMRPHEAEVWIDIPERVGVDEAFIGDFADACYATSTDLRRLWTTCNAIQTSKAVRDRVLVETHLLDQVKFGQRRRFGENIKFGALLPRIS